MFYFYHLFSLFHFCCIIRQNIAYLTQIRIGEQAQTEWVTRSDVWVNKLQILFACEANLRGYQWKPVFQNESLIDRVLATRVSTAPIKTLLYSTSTLAVFMDIVEAYLLLERKMAADLILDFSRRYGPLKKGPQM